MVSQALHLFAAPVEFAFRAATGFAKRGADVADHAAAAPQSQRPRTPPAPEFLRESQWPASPARSGRVAVVIAQHAAQALTALDGTRRGALKEDGVSRPHAGLSNGIRRVAFLQEKERLAAMLPASSADNTYRHNAESPTGAALVNMSTAGKGELLLYTLPVNQRVFSIVVRYPFPIHLQSTPYASPPVPGPLQLRPVHPAPRPIEPVLYPLNRLAKRILFASGSQRF